MNLLNLSPMLSNIDIMGGWPRLMDKDGMIISSKLTEEIGSKFEALDDFEDDNRETQMKEYTFEFEYTGEEQKQLILHQYVDSSSTKRK